MYGLVGLTDLKTAATVGLSEDPTTFSFLDSPFEIQIVSVFPGFPGLSERKFAIWRDFLGIVDSDGQFVQ